MLKHRNSYNMANTLIHPSILLNVLSDTVQVTIVGVIRSTDKSTINIQYKVDDMTAAPMDVKQWIDTEVPAQMPLSVVYEKCDFQATEIFIAEVDVLLRSALF